MAEGSFKERRVFVYFFSRIEAFKLVLLSLLEKQETMKKIHRITLIVYMLIIGLVIATTGNAQKDGQITQEMLKKYRDEFSKNRQLQVMSDIISQHDIQDLAKTLKDHKTPDHYFRYRVKTSGITDQESTGRCWLFTGLNILRPKVMENLNTDHFEFSVTYNFFYDQLEKVNLFYESIITTGMDKMDSKRVEWLFKNPLSDGGQWTGVVNIIEKYGVVPASVMPETKQSTNTRRINSLLKLKIKGDALDLRQMVQEKQNISTIRAKKEVFLEEAYRMLVMAYGEPPHAFTWRYKTNNNEIKSFESISPQDFYKEVLDVDLQDYVMFMNDPSRAYNRLYEIDLDRHVLEGQNWKYINMDTDSLKKYALASIKDNEGMYFSCDVGKYLDNESGYLDLDQYNYDGLFGIRFGMDKKERIQTFSSGSTHGMALIGVDTDEEGRPVKWLLENSWGKKSGNSGYLTMTDSWFDAYMFRLVVHRKYVSSYALKILDQKPEMLPPWDPMFTPNE